MDLENSGVMLNVICKKCNVHLREQTIDIIKTTGEKGIARIKSCPRCGYSPDKLQDTGIRIR